MKNKISRLRSVLAACVLGLAFFPPLVYPTWQQDRPTCTQPDQHISAPLTELGNSAYIRLDGTKTTAVGGLYPNGKNTRPPAHEAAGLALAAQIEPLNRAGKPDPENGKIGLMSLGMSNANMEFAVFIKQVNADASINPHLVAVNGAQFNRTAERWANPQDDVWAQALNRLTESALTPAQVQVVWVKQVLRGTGPFPEKTQALETDLEAIAHNLHDLFPNLKIALISSRTRSNDYLRGLSPEPEAFESGFAVKWMIEKQINGDPALNYDPARGEVVAPYLSWGPYLWIDGLAARADGMTWTAADLRPDCTHPSPAGAQKVAGMLMDFFKTDTLTRGWFLVGGEPTVTAPAVTTPTAAPTGVQPSSSPVASLTASTAAAAVITPPPTAAFTAAVTPAPAIAAGPASPSPVGASAATSAAVPVQKTPTAAPLPQRSRAPLGLAFVVLIAVLLGIGLLVLMRRRK